MYIYMYRTLPTCPSVSITCFDIYIYVIFSENAVCWMVECGVLGDRMWCVG